MVLSQRAYFPAAHHELRVPSVLPFVPLHHFLQPTKQGRIPVISTLVSEKMLRKVDVQRGEWFQIAHCLRYRRSKVQVGLALRTTRFLSDMSVLEPLVCLDQRVLEHSQVQEQTPCFFYPGMSCNRSSNSKDRISDSKDKIPHVVWHSSCVHACAAHVTSTRRHKALQARPALLQIKQRPLNRLQHCRHTLHLQTSHRT